MENKKLTIQGEIKIRLGNENQEPMVVYVSHWHKRFEYWVCEKLNTRDTVFSHESQLINFNYNDFTKIYYEWKITQQDIIKERYIKLLNEHNDNR